MKNYRPHKSLDLWKEAIELVVDIYELVEKFPKSEEFGSKTLRSFSPF